MGFRNPITAGTNIITGSFVVGDPAGAHAILGSDALGADGFRLYAVDGSVLIDLNIASTPTITGAIVRTAATGQRVILNGPGDRLEMWPGTVEVSPGVVGSFTDTPAAPGQWKVGTVIASPNPGAVNNTFSNMELHSRSVDGTIPSNVSLLADSAEFFLGFQSGVPAGSSKLVVHTDQLNGGGDLVWDGYTLRGGQPGDGRQLRLHNNHANPTVSGAAANLSTFIFKPGSQDSAGVISFFCGNPGNAGFTVLFHVNFSAAFDEGLFSTVPVVIVQLRNGAGAQPFRAINVTAAGFDVMCEGTISAGATFELGWIALG